MDDELSVARKQVANEIHRLLGGRQFADPVMTALAKVAGLELGAAKSDKARMEWYDRCIALARSSSSSSSPTVKSKYAAAREEGQ